MRHIIFFLIVLTGLTNAFAQKTFVASDTLSSAQVTELFPDNVRKSFNINFPIYRVYTYSDKSGQYYCVLTESRNVITADNDTFNHKIKAINVKANKGTLVKVWEFSDNIVKNHNDEHSIWFWTKYTDFKDLDNDTLADPIIVYGTSAISGFSDGRIKFFIYHNGRMIAVRHQNGSLDFLRETQVDKGFYNLPQPIQASIRQKMELMTENDHAIFPAGWQAAMNNKKTFFSERKE